MVDQLSFAALDNAAKKKRTKRDVFLAEMDQIVLWAKLEAVIEPKWSRRHTALIRVSLALLQASG
jgi:IS5 family transposase